MTYTQSGSNSETFTPAAPGTYYVVAVAPSHGEGVSRFEQGGQVKCVARASLSQLENIPVDCDDGQLTNSAQATFYTSAIVYSGSATLYGFDATSQYARQVFCQDGQGQ